jgi:chromosome partitioning protein
MIMSFSQQKGGVGKTVTSVMLSQFFSYIKKYRVLLIDMDSQGNATSSFVEKDGTSIKRVIIDGMLLENVLRKTKIDNLDIIVSDIEMEDLEAHLLINPEGPYRLRDLIEDHSLDTKYDIICIDTPPHLGRLTLSSLIASDFVLIPLESKIYAAEGIENLFLTVKQVQKRFNPDLRILGAFINKFEERTIISKDILKSFKEQIPDILLDTHVRYNIRIEECIGTKSLLYTYAPKSNAAIDFTKLGEEVLFRVALAGKLLPEPSPL